MMELHEIEELFKGITSRSAKTAKAFLRNAAILRDPKSTPEMKELAEANIKAITHGQAAPKKAAKPKKAKTAATTAAAPAQSTQLAQQPAGASIKPQTPQVEYHPDYEKYYGITKQHWDSAHPSAHAELVQHHQQFMASQKQQPSTDVKVIKSLDKLHNLFYELKKHL